MPGKIKSKKEKKIDSELKMRVLDVLYNATSYDNPTIDWIRCQDIVLGQYSPQKISHILSFLIDMGLVIRGKLKSQGKMVYRSMSKMSEEGYKV